MGIFSCRKEYAVLVCGFEASAAQPTQRAKPRVFLQQEVAAATSNFSPSALLGRGSHGAVFLAALDGGHLLSAAKVPSGDDSSATDNEIRILSSIPPSPLLVNLLGYTPDAPRIAVVELMPRGSLHDLLYGAPPPPWPRRLRLARRAAEAVARLHALDPPVVHRDLKPPNLLVGADGDARLGDFGLAVRPPSSAAPAGTMGYLDPGYVSARDLSTKVDVYSFGVVLLEIISGRRAIDVGHSPPAVVDWAEALVAAGMVEELWDPRGGKLEDPAGLRDVAELAARCVGQAAEGRPCMAEVAARLRAAERGVRPSGGFGRRHLVRQPRRRRLGHVVDVGAVRTVHDCHVRH